MDFDKIPVPDGKSEVPAEKEAHPENNEGSLQGEVKKGEDGFKPKKELDAEADKFIASVEGFAKSRNSFETNTKLEPSTPGLFELGEKYRTLSDLIHKKNAELPEIFDHGDDYFDFGSVVMNRLRGPLTERKDNYEDWRNARSRNAITEAYELLSY